jgi:hypothetical protein
MPPHDGGAAARSPVRCRTSRWVDKICEAQDDAGVSRHIAAALFVPMAQSAFEMLPMEADDDAQDFGKEAGARRGLWLKTLESYNWTGDIKERENSQKYMCPSRALQNSAM